MKRLLPIANILGFLAVVTVNALANILPIAGKTTGELSALYPNLFVPADITFSIWGLIYLTLLGFVFYQAQGLLPTKNVNPPFVQRISWLFVLSCALNVSWIFTWHYQYVELSLLIMVALLLTLLGIYLRLNIAREARPWKEKLFVVVPFSLYLGWISIATIANVTTLLVDKGWTTLLLGAEFWTIVMIAIGMALTVFILLRRNDIIYALVVIWAYVGIMLKQNELNPSVFWAAATSISIITLILLTRIGRWLSPKD